MVTSKTCFIYISKKKKKKTKRENNNFSILSTLLSLSFILQILLLFYHCFVYALVSISLASSILASSLPNQSQQPRATKQNPKNKQYRPFFALATILEHWVSKIGFSFSFSQTKLILVLINRLLRFLWLSMRDLS